MPDGTVNSISEFTYNPEVGITFPAYYKRYEEIFNTCMHKEM